MDPAERRIDSRDEQATTGVVTAAPTGRRLAVVLSVLVAGVAAFVLAVALVGSDPEDGSAPGPSSARSESSGETRDEPVSSGDPAVSLDTRGELSDGQAVLVTGTGFPAGSDVGVLMCSPHLAPAEGIDRCMTSTFATGRTDSTGRAAIDYRVNRLLTVGEHEIDCAGPPPEGAPNSCRLVMGVVGDFDVYAAADVSFNAELPLEVSSTFKVNPSEGLIDGSEAALEIHDPGAQVQWALTQCVTGTSPPVCTPVRILQPDDPSGAGILLSADGSMIGAVIEIVAEVDDHDCTTAPGVCGVVARNAENGRSHAQRLTFAD